MGYETSYSIHTIHKYPEKARACIKDIEALAKDNAGGLMSYEVGGIPEVSFSSRHFDSTDLQEVSEMHPGVLIHVNGTGEDAGDLWQERWRDGYVEVTSFGRGNYGRFKDLLTPEEEATDFDRAFDENSSAASPRLQPWVERISFNIPQKFI